MAAGVAAKSRSRESAGQDFRDVVQVAPVQPIPAELVCLGEGVALGVHPKNCQRIAYVLRRVLDRTTVAVSDRPTTGADGNG